MKSRFLLALLSVTALVPSAAMAQPEREGRGPRMRERIERGPGGETPQARAEFRNDIRVEAPAPRPEQRSEQRRESPRFELRGDRPDRAAGFERRDPPRDAQSQIDRDALRGQWQRNQREQREDRGWQRGPQPGEPDRGWQRPAQPNTPDRFERRDPPRDAQGQIDREALRRDWPRRDGRGTLDRDRREQWQREQLRRDQWNGDGWAQRDRDWNRNGWDRGNWERDRWGNNGQWDRGWRRDDRYDWNRYRDRNRSLYRLPRYYAPQGWGYGYRRFGVGVRLNSFLFGSNYWINDPFYYRLPETWGPYRWVRYYNDAMLVDIRTGQVVDVEYDIFW